MAAQTLLEDYLMGAPHDIGSALLTKHMYELVIQLADRPLLVD